jgi:Mg2+/Co2+ transporter CorB
MQNELFIIGASILLCLIVSAFFSASETAITAVSRARIYHLILEGNKSARLIGEMRKHKEGMIGGIMIGNNSVNILASALATGLAIRHWGPDGVWYATLIMTVIVVIFVEVLPKTYAIQNAEAVALQLAPGISVVLKLLTPLTVALQLIVRNLLKLFGVDITRSRSLFSASDVIRGTIELHHHEGEVVKQDRDMLGSILDMHEISVGDIMVHRLTIETINIDLPAEQIITAAVKNTHSRIPLWQGNSDNIVGILHVKTLIRHLREGAGKVDAATIRRIMVKPWFIPDTTAIKHQLHAFRAKRQHLAMVVDEYGALQGLVTLEDIIEVIVGRIDDEHDKIPTRELTPAGENAYFVKGSMNIRDMNRELGWNLPDDEAATVAGLVIHEAQKIPEIGEEFEFHHVHFTILDKQQNLITRLKVEKRDAPEDTLPLIDG